MLPTALTVQMLGGFKSTPLARAVIMSPPSPASPPLLRLAPEPPPAADPPAAVPPAPPPPPPPPDPPLWPGALIDSSSLTGRQHGYDWFAQGAQVRHGGRVHCCPMQSAPCAYECVACKEACAPSLPTDTACLTSARAVHASRRGSRAEPCILRAMHRAPCIPSRGIPNGHRAN